ncbi:MAG: transcriptional repressor LexA [Deltaproteobacteria bacterium]|nr:MAG: transcriptional repressor LexA [Deltaproteobacteria bacterium]
MQLTKQQTRVYRYLETYLRRKGRPPSYQEIQDYFGFRSLNSVVKHLKQLERKGYLESPWGNQKRAFRLLPLRTTAATIPFLGRVAAGAPIEAVEMTEAVEVPESLLAGGNNFALQVQGESMVDEGIRDGDVLIIRKQDHADNGQTVVAQIEGEATIKKFYQRDGRVELRPANEELKPLVVPAEKVEIIGVVVGLVRHYKR